MTIGEYANMINGEGWLANKTKSATWKVIPLTGYEHEDYYELPVKAIAQSSGDGELCILYPSLCLFEGTCVSMGRGTDKPFSDFG